MKPTRSEVKILFEASTRDICDHCTIRRERFVYDDLMLCYSCLAKKEDRGDYDVAGDEPPEHTVIPEVHDEHSVYL